MFEYRIIIVKDGVTPVQVTALVADKNLVEFPYEKLTAEQKVVYDNFVNMVKTL